LVYGADFIFIFFYLSTFSDLLALPLPFWLEPPFGFEPTLHLVLRLREALQNFLKTSTVSLALNLGLT
jgi:hypothetical protein